MLRNFTTPFQKFLTARRAGGVLRLWRRWSENKCTRQALRRLDPHMLRDIGYDPSDARDEYTKRFWQD
jgi:uncharacterized protein YjiS (DUF1127 family)